MGTGLPPRMATSFRRYTAFPYQPGGRTFHAERVGSPATRRAGPTRLIHPVGLFQEHDIDSPDDHRPAGFDRLGRIDQITPNDIPSRMVVMRLNGPRPLARLAFEQIVWAWIVSGPPSSRIGKPLLGRAGVAMLFLVAQRIDRLGTKYADQGDEHISEIPGLRHAFRLRGCPS